MTPQLIMWGVSLLLTLMVPFCTWVVMSVHKLKKEQSDLKLYVAENYAKKESIGEVIKKLDHLAEMVNQLVGRLSATP
jgi:hypothetical protein